MIAIIYLQLKAFYFLHQQTTLRPKINEPNLNCNNVQPLIMITLTYQVFWWTNKNKFISYSDDKGNTSSIRKSSYCKHTHWTIRHFQKFRAFQNKLWEISSSQNKTTINQQTPFVSGTSLIERFFAKYCAYNIFTTCWNLLNFKCFNLM